MAYSTISEQKTKPNSNKKSVEIKLLKKNTKTEWFFILLNQTSSLIRKPSSTNTTNNYQNKAVGFRFYKNALNLYAVWIPSPLENHVPMPRAGTRNALIRSRFHCIILKTIVNDAQTVCWRRYLDYVGTFYRLIGSLRPFLRRPRRKNLRVHLHVDRRLKTSVM